MGKMWHISEVGWKDICNDVGLLSNHGLMRPHMDTLRCESYSQWLKIHTKKRLTIDNYALKCELAQITTYPRQSPW
jgi:hypothetical protein